MKIRFLFSLTLVIQSFFSFAQKPDVLLNEYTQKYPQEKIYLHFDKDIYVGGETMWFKAYLLSDLVFDTISSSLFIEMIDDDGKITIQKSLPVYGGTASGNIDLPDSLPRGY